MYTHQQKGYKKNDVDPYCGLIIAPTTDMLMTISLKKFMAYAKPFNPKFIQKPPTITWGNGSIVYGLSADKPHRIEGKKASWIWLDEVWQMKEQVFLECMARVSDTEGDIWMTGSLGTQYNNPKLMWPYIHLKKRPVEGSKLIEWNTKSNPYFPKKELSRQRRILDPQTFRQMYEIDYNVVSSTTVYNDLTEANFISDYKYNPELETSISIDWGWSHPMAATFFQYDEQADTIYQFDEIVQSKLKISELYKKIVAKKYKIDNWYCDIAGDQEREQTGLGNIDYYKDNYNIHFDYKKMYVQASIGIVRSFIKNDLGQRRYYIDEDACPLTADGLRNYSYPTNTDGEISNENPLKKDDDCCDSLRYYFGNRHDPEDEKPTMVEYNRWGKQNVIKPLKKLRRRF